MSNFRRLKPAVIALGCVFIIGWSGFFLVGRLRSDAAQIVDDTLPGLVYGGQIDSELSEGFARTLLVVNSGSPEERDLYLKQLRKQASESTTACRRTSAPFMRRRTNNCSITS